MPNLASQMRTAFASMVANTGSRSPGELLMTRSTSDVAVCCSRASPRSLVRRRSSLSSRVFSMAMTAWSAKVVTKSICFSLNGCGTVFVTKITPTTPPLCKSGTPSADR